MSNELAGIHQVFGHITFITSHGDIVVNGDFEIFDSGHEPNLKKMTPWVYSGTLNHMMLYNEISVADVKIVLSNYEGKEILRCTGFTRNAQINYKKGMPILIEDLTLGLNGDDVNIHLNLSDKKLKRMEFYVRDLYAYGNFKDVFLGAHFSAKTCIDDPRSNKPGLLSYIITVTLPEEIDVNRNNLEIILDYIQQFQSLLSFAICGPVRVSYIEGYDSNNEFVFWHYTGYTLRAERRSSPVIVNNSSSLFEFIKASYGNYTKYRDLMSLDSVLEYFWKGRYDQHLETGFINLSVLMESLKYHCAINILIPSGQNNLSLMARNNGINDKIMIPSSRGRNNVREAYFSELLSMTFDYF